MMKTAATLIYLSLGILVTAQSRAAAPRISAVSGTEGISIPPGISGSDYGFTFTLSPSGRFLLFLKGDPAPDGESDLSLVLKDLRTSEIKRLPLKYTDVSFLGLQTHFQKGCWTAEERFCAAQTMPDNQNYTHAYVTVAPRYSFTESRLRGSADQSSDIIGTSCSDCAPVAVSEAARKSFTTKFGDKGFIGRDYSIGASGKMYSHPSYPPADRSVIEVFDPATSMSAIIRSESNSPSKVCFSQLAVSPDESRLAYARQEDCGGSARELELHVLDLRTKKDSNYGGRGISGVSAFSWSPDSKKVYFVGQVGEARVLYALMPQ